MAEIPKSLSEYNLSGAFVMPFTQPGRRSVLYNVMLPLKKGSHPNKLIAKASRPDIAQLIADGIKAISEGE